MTLSTTGRPGGRAVSGMPKIRLLSAIVAAFAPFAAGGVAAEETPAQAALHRAGDQPFLTLHAVGTQNYVCTAAAGGAREWSFKAPAATLFAGKDRAGRHFAGPSWELSDGSSVTGTVQAKAPGEGGGIPWLRLTVASHAGSGALADAAAVLRINTVGGLAPLACGEAGSVLQVAYQADYVFLRTP